MKWIKENIVAVLALIVAIAGALVAHFASNQSSDVKISIIGTNKSFLKEYISLGKNNTEIFLNAEIKNASDKTKLISITPSLKINLYQYSKDSLVKVSYLNIPFVPETKDFEAYSVTVESEKIESGKELKAHSKRKTVVVNTLLRGIDECINCKLTRFPVSEGYVHAIISIKENNTLSLFEDSDIKWLSDNLVKGLEVTVEDAIFRASSVDGGVPLFAKGFKKLGHNWGKAIESLFMEFEISILVETEDDKSIRASETFYSLAHLIPTANNLVKKDTSH